LFVATVRTISAPAAQRPAARRTRSGEPHSREIPDPFAPLASLLRFEIR